MQEWTQIDKKGEKNYTDTLGYIYMCVCNANIDGTEQKKYFAYPQTFEARFGASVSAVSLWPIFGNVTASKWAVAKHIYFYLVICHDWCCDIKL